MLNKENPSNSLTQYTPRDQANFRHYLRGEQNNSHNSGSETSSIATNTPRENPRSAAWFFGLTTAAVVISGATASRTGSGI